MNFTKDYIYYILKFLLFIGYINIIFKNNYFLFCIKLLLLNI